MQDAAFENLSFHIRTRYQVVVSDRSLPVIPHRHASHIPLETDIVVVGRVDVERKEIQQLI